MSKYHAKKTIIDGKPFDSLKESRRYSELLLLAKAGEVTNIECQPRFLLQESFKKNGKTHRKIEYVADFRVTYADGRVEIEDVKGIKTEVYRLKKKLFEKKYPELTLTEIF
jgi:hypothetical protein